MSGDEIRNGDIVTVQTDIFWNSDVDFLWELRRLLAMDGGILCRFEYFENSAKR